MLPDDVPVPLRDVWHGAGLAVLADVGLLALLGRLLLRVDPLVVEHVLRHVLVPRDLGNLKSVIRSMRISLHDTLLIGYFDYHDYGKNVTISQSPKNNISNKMPIRAGDC